MVCIIIIITSKIDLLKMFNDWMFGHMVWFTEGYYLKGKDFSLFCFRLFLFSSHLTINCVLFQAVFPKWCIKECVEGFWFLTFIMKNIIWAPGVQMRVQTCSTCKHTISPRVAKHGESLPSTGPSSSLHETTFGNSSANTPIDYHTTKRKKQSV